MRSVFPAYRGLTLDHTCSVPLSVCLSVCPFVPLLLYRLGNSTPFFMRDDRSLEWSCGARVKGRQFYRASNALAWIEFP